MPVPDYETFMLPLLLAVKDGAEHHVREVRERLAGEFKLTAEDREMLPSGKQSVFDNRVGWANTYLEKAGRSNTCPQPSSRARDRRCRETPGRSAG